LSGWTENDWSAAARFDLLSSLKSVSQGDVEVAASQLEKNLAISAEELASRSDLSRESATAALQQLCREGRAMFDMQNSRYRWRQLLPFPAPVGEDDKKLQSARKLVQDGNVKCRDISRDDELSEFLTRFVEKGPAFIRSESEDQRRNIRADYRAGCRRTRCVRAMHLRRISHQQIAQRPVRTYLGRERDCRDNVGCQCFARSLQESDVGLHGALTLFTREQAESVIEKGGGTAAGSVSKKTDFLVWANAPDRSWKKRAVWAVPVLTESEFKRFLTAQPFQRVLVRRRNERKPRTGKPDAKPRLEAIVEFAGARRVSVTRNGAFGFLAAQPGNCRQNRRDARSA
jgi:hypothetical protein